MRPAEFTPEAIIQAGQDLQTAGRNITGFALRQKVGGGNPSRLKQVWDEHINSQAVTRAEPVAELPVEVAEEVAAVAKGLTDRLAALAVELNDKAVKAAERRVAEVIRSAGEQRDQAERELADASQTVEDLENKLDETLTEVAGWRSQFSVLSDKYQAHAVELAQVRERLALTEQGAKTADLEHTAELDRLNAGIEAERNRYQQQAEQMRADLAEQKKAAAERDQVRAELATVKAKAEAAEQVHQEQRKTADAARKEADAARKEASGAREDAARLRGQVEALQTQASELTRAFATIQQVGRVVPEPEAVPPAPAPTRAARGKASKA